MRSLRLVTWNCHHGALSARLAELAALSPAIVFLQECTPTDPLPPKQPFVSQRVNTRKAIALTSLDEDYRPREAETASEPWSSRCWRDGVRRRVIHGARYLVTRTALRGRRDAYAEGV